MLNVWLRGTAMRVGLGGVAKNSPGRACSDQPGIAVFVEDDVPVAALECVECEVYLVDGEIGDPAGAQDDDLVSVISAAAGRQTDELRVGGDDELQEQCLARPVGGQQGHRFGHGVVGDDGRLDALDDVELVC